MKNQLIKRSVLILIVSYLCLKLLFFLLNIYAADIYYEKSTTLLADGEISLALNSIDSAVELNPTEPNYYRERARILLSSMVSQDTVNYAPTKLQALSDMKIAYDLNPLNLVTKRNLIPLYYFLSIKDLNGGPSSENVDMQFLPLTREYFVEMKKDYPNDVGVLVLIAKYEKRLGLKDDYVYSVNLIKNLRADLLEWYLID